MDKNQLLLLYISTGLRVLSGRFMLVLTLLLTFTLFAWAMALPTYERIGIAALFALLVFLPMIRLDAGHKKERAVVASEGN